MISVTPQAAAKMREYMQARGKQDKALRIWIKSVSRMAYGMAFDDHRPGDVRVECHGLTVVLDPVSATCLAGARLVWIDRAPGGFALEMPAAPGAAPSGAGEPAPARTLSSGNGRAGTTGRPVSPGGITEA